VLKGYLLASMRSLLKNPGSALVGIAGLTLGLASAIVLFIFISSETSFDSFHAKADRIVRVIQVVEEPGKAPQYASSVDAGMGPYLRENAPGVHGAARLSVLRASAENEETGFAGKVIVHFADPSLLSVFTFPLASGDPGTALAAPGTAVLSPQAAETYFGSADPVGRVLVIRDEMTGIRQPLTVTGVFLRIPESSHLKLDVVVSMATLESLLASSGRAMFSATTYLELVDPRGAGEVERVLNAAARFQPASPGGTVRVRYELEALRRIYLHSKAVVVAGRRSDVSSLLLFTALGAAILAAACINVTNLQTARSLRRGKEIGVRKIAGATRGDIALQFLVESVLLSALSFVLALALVEVILPPLNSFTGGSLSLWAPGAPAIILFSLLAVLAVGVLAGLSPALFLSRLPPTAAFAAARPGATRPLRKALVTVQVALSLLLFLATLSVSLDMRRIRMLPLGFDSPDVITVGIDTPEIKEKLPLLKQRLREVPGVRAVAASAFLPGLGYPAETSFTVSGAEGNRTVDVLFVDTDYLDLYGIPLLRGQGLPAAGAPPAVLANGQADKLLFGGAASGSTISLEVPDNPFARDPRDKPGFTARGLTVTGVTADFYARYPAGPVRPLLLYPDTERCQYLSIRVEPGALTRALPGISAAWRNVLPHNAFDYRVLVQSLALSHMKNRVYDLLLLAATAMSVFIALMGFLGLVSFETERRTKEVGIRKALGATPARIAARLAADFLRPVAAANVLAWCAAAACIRPLYTVVEYRFPFRLRWELFPLSLLFSLAIVAAAVGARVLRASRTDPARALRYE
jgi:putative ABC transport system permease protein